MREAAPLPFHFTFLNLFITWGPLLDALVSSTIFSRSRGFLQPSQWKRSSRTLGNCAVRNSTSLQAVGN